MILFDASGRERKFQSIFEQSNRKEIILVSWAQSPAARDPHGFSCLFQVTNKQRREQQRLEKKKRQEERHRLKALENRNGSRDRGREADVNTQVTLVKTFAALNI